MNNESLINWLFETQAFRVCPENKPFWYTSGTIGPYYVNTHFLYGSEVKAVELLNFIDSAAADKTGCTIAVKEKVMENYNSDRIFKGLIDEMMHYISENIGVENIDYISGGERRDWFFSIAAAVLLKKPHVTLFKDLSAVICDSEGNATDVKNLNNTRVLHIADLITEASSYERAWIPAIESLGGKMAWSLVVVDRMQGGAALLGSFGVESHAMVSIEGSLFDKALEMSLVNKGQHEMLMEYAKDPRGCMSSFLKKHPEFMEQALKADEKTVQRARLCIDKKFYDQ